MWMSIILNELDRLSREVALKWQPLFLNNNKDLVTEEDIRK